MGGKSGGFTLVELIVVIAILGILLAIAVPRLSGFRSNTEESVCAANLITAERTYSAFLVENDIDHEDNIFNQFLVENFEQICPTGGVVSYEDGEVKCSVHRDEEQPPEEEVPWL